MHGIGCVWQGVCMHGRGACVSLGMYAGEMATEVDSMHPTGMHSCSIDVLNLTLDGIRTFVGS